MACAQEENNVMKAYELRMQGKAGQALILIDSIIANDSTNAMAHFERSRILNYMMRSSRDISIDEVLSSINKATTYDKDNVHYAFTKAIYSFLNAYIIMQSGQGEIADAVETVCNEFEHVIEMKPDHKQAMLYLVDIYSQLPKDMGGDNVKAEFYTDMLKHTDDYYYARANLLLNPQNEVDYWLNYLDTHDKTPEILKEIGIAYIYQEDPENSEKYFTEAIQLDPRQNILLLDQAKYYMFLVMQDMAKPDSVLPISAKYINMYLSSKPAPIIPMEAYAIGMLVKTKMFTGQKEEGQELMEKAKSLDPHFSRATGIPNASQFEPPNKLTPHYNSFFRPF